MFKINLLSQEIQKLEESKFSDLKISKINPVLKNTVISLKHLKKLELNNKRIQHFLCFKDVLKCYTLSKYLRS